MTIDFVTYSGNTDLVVLPHSCVTYAGYTDTFLVTYTGNTEIVLLIVVMLVKITHSFLPYAGYTDIVVLPMQVTLT